VTDRRVRNLVMLTVLMVWAVYLLASVLRGETPEKWAWGIGPGAYLALYRPGLGKPKRKIEEDDDEPERRPARGRTRPAGDE
jgi:hypothetical protein